VTYSVRFNVSLGAVSVDARAEIDKTVHQIAEAVSTVPDASPFWSSMRHSVLQVDVKGWRVVYLIDAACRDVCVVELQPLRH